MLHERLPSSKHCADVHAGQKLSQMKRISLIDLSKQCAENEVLQMSRRIVAFASSGGADASAPTLIPRTTIARPVNRLTIASLKGESKFFRNPTVRGLSSHRSPRFSLDAIDSGRPCGTPLNALSICIG